MSPKGTFRQAPEAILPQIIQNVGARTVYGDARAATEATMMVEHAKCLRLAGVIDDDMERALSQPHFDKARELKTKYTRAYLAMHPNYIGSNVDEIPSYKMALRRQNARDAAQKKLLSDYKLGKIDEHGRSLYRHGKSSEDVEADDDSDSTLALMDSSDESDDGSPRRREPVEELTTTTQAFHVIEATSPGPSKHTPILSISPALAIKHRSHTAPSSGTKSWRPSTAPLAPLPGQPDYAKYTYYEVAALGRARHIPTGGNTQEIRNRLVRDDINVAQNKKRERSRYKGVGRTRGFKTVTPLDDIDSPGKEEVNDGGSLDDAEEGDFAETEFAGRKNGKENIVPGQGSEGETSSNGEEVLKILKGSRGVKRKDMVGGDVWGSNGGREAKKARTTTAV
jgi:hypothetical protein